MTTRRKDIVAILILVTLWMLFFWRLLTPITSDQASLKQGDFSGQFVAFAAYQYERFVQGEVPLWNPYNNGGFPFIADTQAAVFYPPRLITIALSNLAGGWSYHALELEMAVHVLVYSLLMYTLVRRMTYSQRGTVTGGIVTALIASYGGFFTGYPPLQLAILEAGIWLSLALIGIFEASKRDRREWRWFILTGFALGLSWLAGHPQTSWFLTFLLVAYTIYRSRHHWQFAAMGIIIIGMISGGLAAVQLLPGVEYLMHTARVDLTFDAKGNGFPFRDVLQFVFPGQLSLFSPLYIGISGLALVIVALRGHVHGTRFWILTALITLGLSFGANSMIFPALYNVLPGLRYFRGQERAAYLIANSLAIVAGLTTVHLINRSHDEKRAVRWTLTGIIAVTVAGIALAPTGWLLNEDLAGSQSAAVFATIIAAGTLLTLWQMLKNPEQQRYQWLLVALIIFDLFSTNMDADSTYDPVPPGEQLSMTPPPLVAQALMDSDTPFRVDGFRGLTDNYGSLYQLPDMRGISPLFLDGPFRIIEPDKINPLAWELFAIRYVYSDWQELPVDSEITGTGEDRFGPVNLHRLADPRPFAYLLYDVEVLDSDEFAHALLSDPNFNPRTTIILNQEPDITVDAIDAESSVEITTFEPERIAVTVDTDENAVLSLAHPHYPGWIATLDGEPIEALRAYGALTAIPVPAGTHEITLVYNPLTYRIGAALSLVTWGVVGILGLFWLVRRR